MTDPSPVQPDGEITLTVDGHIAVIHISRPNKLNSFTIPMVEQLESHLAVIDDSEDVRAVIVTSAGSPSGMAATANPMAAETRSANGS